MEEKRKFIRIEHIVMLFVIIALIGVVIFAAGFFKGQKRLDAERKAQVTANAVYESINNVSSLSGAAATYKGIAKLYNENDPEKLDCYVYYEAKINAGIDFADIEVAADNETKVLTVKIPEIILHEPDVEMGSLDFIFENKKANVSGYSQKAYEACIKDARDESKKEDEIKKLAEDNIKSLIKAVTEPVLKASGGVYTLEII